MSAPYFSETFETNVFVFKMFGTPKETFGKMNFPKSIVNEPTNVLNFSTHKPASNKNLDVF